MITTDQRLEHIYSLIAKAMKDIEAGNKPAARGKLGAARANIILVKQEIKNRSGS